MNDYSMTKEIFNSIPKADIQHESSVNYDKKRKEEAMSLVSFIKYQMEKASRKGEFSCEVAMEPKSYAAWEVIDLKFYMKSIMMDLGYKIEFPSDNIYTMVIHW